MCISQKKLYFSICINPISYLPLEGEHLCLLYITQLYFSGCSDGAGEQRWHRQSYDDKAVAVLLEDRPDHSGSNEQSQSLDEQRILPRGNTT